MSRTQIARDLDPLPSRPPASTNHGSSAALLQTLRSLAIKNQREQPRVFYSLRQVARTFRVPVSTVARAYNEMEQEGLISRVRGSKTVLNGLRYNRRRVRAFVGLPAEFATFMTISEYRKFFEYIRNELWLRGFGTSMVFYRPHEAIDGELADRFKSYEVDVVIWVQPNRNHKESLLRLADQGIRVVRVSEVGTPGLPSRYHLWREHGMDALLKEWKKSYDISRVVVLDSKEHRSVVTEELLRVLLHDWEITPIYRSFEKETVSELLRSLCRMSAEGIIFPASALVSLCACRCPELLIELMQKHRVALLDGAFDMPFAKVADAVVDLVSFDWPMVTESIVNDLVTLEAFDKNRHTTFNSQVFLRIPLNKIAEPLLPLRRSN